MAKLVSKVYGDALFEAAMDKNSVDTLYEEASAIIGILKENPELVNLLTNPQIVKEEKLTILKNIFDGRISEEMMGFLSIVVSKDRQKDFLPIFEYFVKTVKEYKKIGTVSVVSAVELTDVQKTQVQNRLLEITGYKELEIVYDVDKELIGGMVIRIGDRVVDSSVKTQLYEMKKNLSSIQLA